MATNTPGDGAPRTTEQSPRWEGPKGNKPRGYLPPNPDSDRDAWAKTTATRKRRL